MEYQPDEVLALTCNPERVRGQWQVGSLTGAVASQKVTEAPKGALRLNGNQPQSVKAQARLTARPMRRAEAKAGPSDPTPASGSGVA